MIPLGRGRVVGVVVAALALPLPAGAQSEDAASLAGTVVDEMTGRRLDGASVTIVGTAIAARTDEFGQFLLEGLPTGAVSLRVASEGYVSVVESIEATSTDYLQVRLRPVAAALEELLVVADRPRRGGVRPTDRDPSRTALDVLAEDVPGVMVRRGSGDLGIGAAIAIRGVGSFRGNAPDVYVDGARLDPRDGLRTMNVLDLIPAETIERIRVLRGPSAAAPFALAANGVILIETVRGPGGG